MAFKFAASIVALSRGASALFKVEGVEADESAKKLCVWSTQTNSSTTLACLDGSSCDISKDGWNCCGEKFRAKCPMGYTACSNLIAGGTDFMCKKDCSNNGGARSCDEVHPCAWTSSPMKACQELVFGYGQYILSRLGADGCKPGWKPIQDEVKCRDAQTHAGVPFGYVEKDNYAVCSYCTSCSPPTVHLHTNHKERAKWICQRDGPMDLRADSTVGCTDADPPTGMGPRDQFGHGCADYKTHKDWCGNHDDPDFSALTDCCACAGQEKDRRRRGNGNTLTGERRRGNGPGTLDLQDDRKDDE